MCTRCPLLQEGPASSSSARSPPIAPGAADAPASNQQSLAAKQSSAGSAGASDSVTLVGMMNVSGSIVPHAPGSTWTAFMGQLAGRRLLLSTIAPPQRYVAVLELSGYRLISLPNMPDASGCVQLEPADGGHRAWLHVSAQVTYRWHHAVYSCRLPPVVPHRSRVSRYVSGRRAFYLRAHRPLSSYASTGGSLCWDRDLTRLPRRRSSRGFMRCKQSTRCAEGWPRCDGDVMAKMPRWLECRSGARAERMVSSA